MIGKRLKEARISRRLTQEEVAETLNTSRSNISKYETDKLEPNIQTLIEICELYEVSADEILFDKKKEPKLKLLSRSGYYEIREYLEENEYEIHITAEMKIDKKKKSGENYIKKMIEERRDPLAREIGKIERERKRK